MNRPPSILDLDPRQIRFMSARVNYGLDALLSLKGQCPQVDSDLILTGFLLLEELEDHLEGRPHIP